MAPLFLEGGSGAHGFGERNLGQLQGVRSVQVLSVAVVEVCVFSVDLKMMARCHGFIYVHICIIFSYYGFLIFLRMTVKSERMVSTTSRNSPAFGALFHLFS